MSKPTLIKLYSSSSVSTPAFMLDGQALPAFYHEMEILADTQLANFSVYRSSYAEDRRKRYKKAAALLGEWVSESGDHDEVIWRELGTQIQKPVIKLHKP